MIQKEGNKLDYLSQAFSGLSSEKKDTILHKARSLLSLQQKEIYPQKKMRSLIAGAALLPMKGKEQGMG